MVKILCISDLHGFTPKLQQSDIILHAGDICPTIDHSIPFQRSWLETNFTSWVRNLDCKHFIYCAGNHDWVYYDNHSHNHKSFIDKAGFTVESSKRIYLENAFVEVEGLKIWGSPWQNWFYDWAFNAHEPELEIIYSKIPNDVDIIVSHGPPFGYGDLAPRYKAGKSIGSENAGSKALLSAIDRINPKLVVTGHIHSGYGVYQYKNTKIVNASLLDEKYNLVNKPIEVELDVKA